MLQQIKRLGMFLIISSFFACSGTSTIRTAVRSELAYHPESQLVDLYKYFFQDYFGPGHLISDTTRSRLYLENEISRAKRFEPFDCQDLKAEGQFVRVNLSLLQENRVSQPDFLEAFFKSSEEFVIPNVADWRERWKKIIAVIESMELDLEQWEGDRELIDSVLNSGGYVIHHSDVYIDRYDPHYRIISKKQWRKMKVVSS